MKARTRSRWAVLSVVSIALALLAQRQLSQQELVLDAVFLFGLAVLLFFGAAGKFGDDELRLWPNNAPLPEGTCHSLTSGHLRRVLLAVAGLCVLVAFVSLADNHFTLAGVLAWSCAAIAWLLGTAEVREGISLRGALSPAAFRARLRTGGINLHTTWVALALVAVLMVSLFFHVYRIASVPAEPQSDHVEASEDVRSILHGNYMIFFPRNTGREGTQFYLTALLSLVFGYGFATLKLTMALVGALNVIPMYLLGKEIVDKRLGLLAAFFMAVSYWHLIISRIGWRIALAPFWTAATLYCLLRAFRSERRNDFLLAGLTLGAGLYGYMSFRVTPLLVVSLFALEVILRPRQGFDLKRFLSNGLLLVLTSLLVYLPMLRYMYDEPRMLWYRVLTRTTSLERPLPRSEIAAIFANNVKRALLMFNWRSDGAWTTSVPGRPALDNVSAGLLVLGAAYILYLLSRRRRVALYLVLALFALQLPSTLSIAFPIENPSHIRMSGVIPLAALLVALPFHLVATRLTRALRGGPGVVLVVALGGLLLWRTAQLNFGLYYVEYDQEYRQAAWNATDIARVIRGFGETFGSIHDAYYVGTAYWVDHRAIALALRDMEWNNLIMDLDAAEPQLAEPRNRLFILRPDNVQAEGWLWEHYPQGQLLRFQASLPDKDFLIFFAPVQR